MQNQESYKKVVEALKRSEPENEHLEQLKSRIIREISHSHEPNKPYQRLMNLLFGWVDVSWMRWSVASLAIFLLGAFLFQQFGMQQRITLVEQQLIHLETAKMGPSPAWNAGHKVLFKLYNDTETDSITVSRKDLEALVKDYGELLEKPDRSQNERNNKKSLKL
ncbi:MAG: hypothetical protein GY790_12835 [Bacteroidetes bacterium]|nr:hypothetical protein [Bacteroidota bacterium]